MKISFRKISTKELATLCERVIEASKKSGFPEISGHPLLLGLEKIYKEYEAVYTKASYSGKGVSVAKADKERDAVYSDLKGFLKAYSRMKLFPEHKDAEKLYEVIHAFGKNIGALNYAEETAQMKKLIEELNKPEHHHRLSVLRLDPYFNELKLKQEAFEAVYTEQTQANSELRQLKSATALKHELENQLKVYLSLVNAMKSLENWKRFYSDLNEIVKGIK